MRRALLTITALLSVLVLPRGALAGERFILRASPNVIKQVCADHNLRVVRHVGRQHLVLVEARGSVDVAALTRSIQADSRVYDFEAARRRKTIGAPAAQPAPGAAQPAPGASDEPIDRAPVDFYGATAWAGYVSQPAVTLVGADTTRAAGDTGAGVVVAVIDSGIDPDHPVLRTSLVPGYDFTREQDGASEWLDLEQSNSAQLEQSNSAQLEQSNSAQLEQSNSAQLEQSNSAQLEQSNSAQLEQSANAGPAFGHGTMVAGLVRVVAPGVRILPLKVVAGDGTSSSADIIDAIYYAVDHGAKVINMSFSSDSREMKRAIQYATNRGVVCVAAAGNQGESTIVFPAALTRVLGVAATTLDDARASFSNYGPRLVSVAAPGENLLTTYPGERYALVSGTSFSTAIVSGAAAILAGAQPGMDYADAMDAFHYSLFLGRDLGFGRIDIPSALSAVQAQVWLKPKRGKAARAEEDES